MLSYNVTINQFFRYDGRTKIRSMRKIVPRLKAILIGLFFVLCFGSYIPVEAVSFLIAPGMRPLIASEVLSSLVLILCASVETGALFQRRRWARAYGFTLVGVALFQSFLFCYIRNGFSSEQNIVLPFDLRLLSVVGALVVVLHIAQIKFPCPQDEAAEVDRKSLICLYAVTGFAAVANLLVYLSRSTWTLW